MINDETANVIAGCLRYERGRATNEEQRALLAELARFVASQTSNPAHFMRLCGQHERSYLHR